MVNRLDMTQKVKDEQKMIMLVLLFNSPYFVMWKSKTRVTSSNPGVTSSNPRVTSSIHELED